MKLAVEGGNGLDLRNVFSVYVSGNGVMRYRLKAIVPAMIRRMIRRFGAHLGGPNLCMSQVGLHVPCTELPDGYALARSPIDAVQWAGLLAAGGDLGPWDEQRLRIETARLVPGTQVFLMHGEQPVACAGVYEREPTSWEIGWIAVHPGHRRCGLGQAITLLALQRARGLPARMILLFTQDHRLDAIRLYLRLGFRPVMRHRTHRRRWRALIKCLPREVAADIVSSLQVNQ